MKKDQTIEQRVFLAEACQTAAEYKARHAYLHATLYSREEWDTMWLRSEKSTWTHWFGRMVGYDEIYEDSVLNMDRIILAHKLGLMSRYPVFQGHDFRSTACSGCHVLASEVIEAAEDSQSVKAFYLTPGTLMFSIGFDCEHRSGEWAFERYGSEFVWEDGRWQWMHEQVCPDVDSDYDGRNWARDDYLKTASREDSGEEFALEDWPCPERLTFKGWTHHPISIIQPVQRSVMPPEPYVTSDRSPNPLRENP